MNALTQQPGDAIPQGIRSTQRPPKSCSFCYRRKIKCDRQLPCSQCRRRGEASMCRVEPVLVKGRLIQNRDEILQPSYSEVVQENAELRSQSAEVLYREDLIDEKEQLLFADMRNHQRPRVVHEDADVLFPSTHCSSFLLGREGPRSWLHLAIDWDEFEAQQQEFEQDHLEGTRPVLSADPAWLSLYFGCLVAQLTFVSDEDVKDAGLPDGNVKVVLHNWYDSALFFLHQSEFLSVLDIRTVQTIIILDVAFTNFGDLNLYCNLWACAARISQALRINLEEHAYDTHTSQGKTRIWWALVLTDWLSGQLNIRKDDFSIKIPEMTFMSSDTHTPVSPNDTSSQYFACMAHISQALYRFRDSVSRITQTGSTTLTKLVINADNELAEVISQLPAHLSTYDGGDVSHVGVKQPLLEWQKQSIAVALLYTRIVINRAPLRDTTSDELSNKRALVIYLSSAHAIIDLVINASLPYEQFLIWTFQLALYSSTAAIIANLRCCSCGGTVDEHRHQALTSIGFLQRLAERSVLAGYASTNLVNMLNEEENRAMQAV